MRKFIELTVPLLIACLAPFRADLSLAAEGATTLTPDGLSFLVSKDVGAERWTVSLNLSPSDQNVVVNVTGNVFKSDGGPPSFVNCRPRDDSTGTLRNAASKFRFTCDGADACATNAHECARTGWSRISDELLIPAQVFLPSGGLTQVADDRLGLRSKPDQGFLDRMVLATAELTSLRRLLSPPWQKLASWMTRSAEAQTNDRGATLSFDGLSFLVNKDINQQRWSIGLNYLPVRTAEGGFVNRLQAITGNVLRGSETPTFVYCSVRDDSTGTLDDPSSIFRLSCLGADGCTTTAEECAQSSWTTISDDVSIPASIFLPSGGLTATPQSDPEIVVIGRMSDGPSYETPDYTTPAGGSSAIGLDSRSSCAVGKTCLASRVGSCANVSGRLVDGEQGCLCRIETIDPSCITCDGVSATGQCGQDCEFSLGGSTARGTCLPASSSSADCICQGIGAGQDLVVGRCGGPLAAACPSDRCCTDDPMDGCEQEGSAACPGICVVGSCDGTDESCGSCFAMPTGLKPTPEPTVAPTPGGEPTPRRTASPRPSATPTATPTPAVTASPRPAATPTAKPTPAATASPRPSVAPTANPTPSATASPQPTPESTATVRPTKTPTPTPSPEPVATPSPEPSCGDRHKDPGEQCEPTINTCGSGHCSSVTCQCFSCTPQTLRGDNGTDSVATYDLGISVGDFGFQFNAFQSDADQFIVSYEGQVLFDSGCNTGGVPDFYKLSLPGGSSTKIQVQVDGSCKSAPNGSWEYTIACPD